MHALFSVLLTLAPLWRPWVLRTCLGLVAAALVHRGGLVTRSSMHRRNRTHLLETAVLPQPIDGQSHWRKKPPWVTQEVLRLAVFLPSCRAVADAFNALHGQHTTVGKSYVHELCRDHSQQLHLLKRDMRRTPPRAIPVGKAFSLDLTAVRVASQRCIVFGLIDQGTRRALRLKVLSHKCAWSLLGQLCLAIAEHGLPRSIRTDNESMFTGKVWKAGLKVFGIRHERKACAALGRTGAWSASSAP